MEFTVHEAKTHFSKLLAKVSDGEEVIITSGRDRKPMAKLVALPKQTLPPIGFAKHWPDPGPEFFDPLPEDELALCEGEGD
jgi:prevent-host-death family protein